MSESENTFPRAWVWDEDGDKVVGRYRGVSQGHTKTGDTVPIVELEVAGEPRALWLFHTALREAFADELRARAKHDLDLDDLDLGETVTVARGELTQSQSAPDRQYRRYRVEFENKSQPTPLELLSVSVPLGATQPPPVDLDIPF